MVRGMDGGIARPGAAVAGGAIALALVAALLLGAPRPASASTPVAGPADRYDLAGGCFALRSLANGRYVAKGGGGYAASAEAVGSAEPFRMQATDLGRYLFYGAAAVIAVAIAGPSAGGDPRPTDASASAVNLSPRQLAGLRVVAGFSGRRPPAKLRRMVSNGDLAGVILFSGNVGGRRAVRRLTRRLQSIPRLGPVNEPLLVMVDQEGGLVRRLPGPPRPSAREVGRRGPAFAAKLGRATGESLAGMGINVNLAPVLDVARRGGFIDQQMRAYARRPGRVGRVGTRFARGMQARGVAATAKHFPGLGVARDTTDERPVTLRLSRRTLRRVDEAPYRRFVAARGSLVMLSLASYPALARGPAALAGRIATGELRRRLGFRGVTVSDDLNAPAATAVGGTAKVALRGARAGTDLLLYSDLRSAARASLAIRRAIARGALPRKRARASAKRVLALREGF